MYVEPLHRRSRCPTLALRLVALPGLCWLDGEAAHRDGACRSSGRSGGADPRSVRVRRATAARRSIAWSRGDARRAGRRGAAPAAEPEQVPRWVGYLAYDAHHAAARRHAALAACRAAGALFRALRRAVRARSCRAVARSSSATTREACRAAASLRIERSAVRAPSARVRRAHATDRRRSTTARSTRRSTHRRGDVYQINLARCFRARVLGLAARLVPALRAREPGAVRPTSTGRRRGVCRAADGALPALGRATRLLWTRPIKGTIARARRGRAPRRAALLRATPRSTPSTR